MIKGSVYNVDVAVFEEIKFEALCIRISKYLTAFNKLVHSFIAEKWKMLS